MSQRANHVPDHRSNKDGAGLDEFAETRTVLDIEGNALEVIDARGNTAQEVTYGMAGQGVLTDSVDAGERRSVTDVVGNPLRSFDERGFVRRFEYDALLRPTHAWVNPPAANEFLAVRTAYGELVTSPQTLNLRGRPYRIYDGAGASTHDAFDFAGNLLTATRQLAATYTTTPDWTPLATETTIADLATAAAPLLESETFVIDTTYDALGRPLTQTTPDDSEVQLTYNDAGLLDAVDARIRGAGTATAFITNIDYDVRGRREHIDYANGTVTAYTYDPITQRLTDLRTTRTSDSAVLQDLHYTYDPVGNITEITDAAQQTVYFQNAVVTPDQRFEYDALYRLRRAEGREHSTLTQPTDTDLTFGPQPHPDDPSALRTYAQDYVFDLVGNLLQLQHTATGGNFTRQYTYAANGNRLLSNSAPGESTAPFSHTYAYDLHGNMTAMPHLAALDWDHADRLQHCDLGGGGDVYFLYDTAGTRTRKVQINQAGSQATERIYLGPYELYRERAVVAGVLQSVDEERQTLHITDDTGRLCMVETKTIELGSPITTPVDHLRYQYANHLGTAALELDATAAVISYEEFHPFGTTSYAAKNSLIDVSAKRYRYIGKERDEETGLYHLGARYYASWLGRWTAADPIGLGDGVNRYAYARSNPVRYRDTRGTAAEDPLLVALEQQVAADLDALNAALAGSDVTDVSAEQREARKTVARENRRARANAHVSGETPAELGNLNEDVNAPADVPAQPRPKPTQPPFRARGSGVSSGRRPTTDEFGNQDYTIGQTPVNAGPLAPLQNEIVLQGGPAGDTAFSAFSGAGLTKGGFLRGKPKRTSPGGRPSDKAAGAAPEEGGTAQVVRNKRAGIRREKLVQGELEAEFPDASVQPEQLLRTADGKKAIDPLTGTGRRVDHVVIQRGVAIDSVEVTGLKVNKAAQVAKEGRIRAAGGTFVRDRTTGELVDLSKVQTRIIRRQ